MSQLQAALATPNSLTSSATNYVGDVLNGKYLDPSTNTALAATGDAISSGAQRYLNQNLDQIGSNFGLAGGTSSSAMANAKKSAAVSSSAQVGQSLAALYGNAYQNERANQQNVLGSAQSLSQAPVQQLMMALGLGSQQQALAQQQANMPLQNYMTQMGVRQQSLQQMLQTLQGVDGTYHQPVFGPSELEQNFAMAGQASKISSEQAKAASSIASMFMGG